MDKLKTFVFFGIVGSGKGTQVELLTKYLKDKNNDSHTVILSPGNEFRKITSSGSYTGQLVKERLEKGFLQPNFITISLCSHILIDELKQESFLIVDGYPRSIAQAEAFEAAMDFYKREDISIIYIEVGKEEAVKRMKLRGRSDDTDEAIAQRFDVYVNEVLPAMDYFKGKAGYSLYNINGEQSIEDVHKELISKIGI